MKIMYKRMGVVVLSLVWTYSTTAYSEETKNDKVWNENLSTQIQTQNAGALSQGKISKTANETKILIDEYRIVLKKVDNTRIYNNQLKKLLLSQTNEMQSVKEQIVNLKNTNKEITPLMLRMMSLLEQFVSLDVPFLPVERAQRIQQLKIMMDRADVSVSEKYRRILEAYQVENEYGRTIEAYRGVYKKANKEYTVDYLKVGRVTLMFRSLDGGVSGQWDPKTKSWIPLPDEYKNSLLKGIKIARKQMTPDLFKIPVSTPEVIL